MVLLIFVHQLCNCSIVDGFRLFVLRLFRWFGSCSFQNVSNSAIISLIWISQKPRSHFAGRKKQKNFLNWKRVFVKSFLFEKMKFHLELVPLSCSFSNLNYNPYAEKPACSSEQHATLCCLGGGRQGKTRLPDPFSAKADVCDQWLLAVATFACVFVFNGESPSKNNIASYFGRKPVLLSLTFCGGSFQLARIVGGAAAAACPLANDC